MIAALSDGGFQERRASRPTGAPSLQGFRSWPQRLVVRVRSIPTVLERTRAAKCQGMERVSKNGLPKCRAPMSETERALPNSAMSVSIAKRDVFYYYYYQF
jgi:hypothetical protein